MNKVSKIKQQLTEEQKIKRVFLVVRRLKKLLENDDELLFSHWESSKRLSDELKTAERKFRDYLSTILKYHKDNPEAQKILKEKLKNFEPYKDNDNDLNS